MGDLEVLGLEVRESTSQMFRLVSDLYQIGLYAFQNMYNNKEILKQYSLIDKKFRFLFEIYTNNPKMLPVKWQTSNYKTKKNVKDAIIATDVCDYIASMTDNYFEMKLNVLRS